jgi:protocatechuate 3,4-dioxygenase alpha subunit
LSFQATTWQTVGPFFRLGLEHLYRAELAGPEVAGERIQVSGRILDGDGQPVPDGLVEIWQANPEGKYAHPEDTQDKAVVSGFTGYGRVPTDDAGQFRFTTVKPGPVPGPSAQPQAPHLLISVFTRGLLRRLVTRMYFPDEAANAQDLALSLVPPERRDTLVAMKVGGRPGALQWNIVLQGENETVFFDF